MSLILPTTQITITEGLIVMDLNTLSNLGPWGLAAVLIATLIMNWLKDRKVIPDSKPAPQPEPKPDDKKPDTPILDIVSGWLKKLLGLQNAQVFGASPVGSPVSKSTEDQMEQTMAHLGLIKLLQADPHAWAQHMAFVKAHMVQQESAPQLKINQPDQK